MELVSANTKNYLFLTLSQYNELPELVRARVSMRRDQAFWEGGNSFIACESFRITAAPNEGGLYYQIVPDDFFLGAVQDNSSEDGAFETLQGIAPPGIGSYNTATNVATGRSDDKFSGKNIQVTRSESSPSGWKVDMELYTCAPEDHLIGTQPPIEETDLADCIPRIARYLGQHKVTQGSLIEIMDDDDPATTIQFRLKNDPLKRLKGPGKGPSGLFCPYVTFTDPATAWGKFDTITNNYAKSVGLRVTSKVPIQISTDWSDYVHQLLGSGAFLQMAGAPDSPAGATVHNALFADSVFEILNPATIVTDINDATDPATGFYREQLRWESQKHPLNTGSLVWQQQANVVSGKVIGAGTYMSQSYSYVEIVVDMRITPAARAALATANQPFSQATLSDFRWHMLNAEEPMQDAITCHVGGDIIAWTPTQSAPDPNTGHTTALGPDNSTGRSSAIEWLKPDLKGSITHKRGPSEETMVFTPNEFFYMFNEPRSDLINPWALQTDENGGFVIQWAPPLDNSGVPDVAYNSFMISKSMTESLGLNTYMEYYEIDHTKEVSAYYATCTNLLSTGELSYKSIDDQTIDLPYQEVKDFSTKNTINPVNWNIGDRVYTEPTKSSPTIDFVLCDVQAYDSSDHKSVLHKLNGTLKENADGVEYYEYSNPPTFGRIGNDAQVSVESWGTFAGINLVIPNIPFQSMLGGESDSRILASLRLPFEYNTNNQRDGQVASTGFSYYGDLLFNSDSSRSYLRITTDQQLFDCDVEARLIRRDGTMEVMQIPYKGQFQVKLRLLQTQ